MFSTYTNCSRKVISKYDKAKVVSIAVNLRSTDNFRTINQQAEQRLEENYVIDMPKFSPNTQIDALWEVVKRK